MYTVMVTGGIGSGKSTLVELFKEHGAMTVDLDTINRELISSDQALIAELADRFGADILDEDGSVVASRLARVAFASEEATRDLNAISFPYITDVATRYILDCQCTPQTDAKVLVIEVQLLTEAPQFAQLADEVIAVCSPSELRLARAVRRGMDADDVMCRMQRQPSDAERAAIADTVMDNAGSLEDLRAWVDEWWDNHVMKPVS